MSDESVRWIFMPYCVKRLTDGRYIVLNRRYKPLGIRGSEHISYEDHPSAVRIKITKSQACKISHNGSEDLERIYLYDDSSIPAKGKDNLHGYMERLHVFMQLKVEDS